MTTYATSVGEGLALLDSRIGRIKSGQEIAEEAAVLAGDLRAFTYAAWTHIIPGRLVRTWHIDAICDHVAAAYRREIARLIITIPPGYLKSSLVSVLGPAWRWTHEPRERIISASHADHLATRDTRRSRTLITTPWFQQHWPDVTMLDDENLKTRYTNTRGGHRIATHVGGGTGERGTVLLLDDPHNAQDALASTETELKNASDWIGNTWSSRLDSSVDDRGVKIVIGQRIHPKDVIGFLLGDDPHDDRWTHLCLPARYDRKHPFVYPSKVKIGKTTLQGDRRRKKGELLAPSYMDEAGLADVQHDMTEQTKQAQYQQLPRPREGAILKRADWRYFPRQWLNDDELHKLPAFRLIVCSWDTSFKAKVSSDKVAGGAWGISERIDQATGEWVMGADHFLLAGRHERLSLQQTKDAMKDMRQWCVTHWPELPVYVIVEKSANGVEIIEQMEREITGVVPITASVDKKLRAEAAAPALETHNVFVPGAAMPNGEEPDPNQTDAWVMEGIEQAAMFKGTGGEEDDWVDHLTQMVNWVRTKEIRPTVIEEPVERIPAIGGRFQQRAATGLLRVGR